MTADNDQPDDELIREHLARMWGEQRHANRGRRGPKAALSVDLVARTAVGIADADGLDAVSMRRIADELGVGTMSLYRYVPGKDELLELMMDTVIGDHNEAVVPSDDWRESVRSVARSWRAFHLAHPWAADVPMGNRPPLGPNVLDAEESTLALLSGTGLTDGQIVAVANILGAFIDGWARQVRDVERMEYESGVTDEEWWSQRNLFWEEFFDPDRFPTISRIYDSGGYDDVPDTFDLGIEVLIGGIDAMLAA